MKAIYKRELSALIGGKSGWLYLFGMLAVGSGATMLYNLFNQYADFSNTLLWVKYAYIALIPFVACRVFAGERPTDRLLRALPVKPCAVVCGKYLAALTLHTLACALLMLYPLALSFFGDISLRSTACSLIGVWALGAGLIAFCAIPALLSGSRLFAFLRGAVLTAILCFLAEILVFFTGTAGSNMLITLGLLVAIVAVFYWIFNNMLVGLIVGLVFEAPLFLARISPALSSLLNKVLESVSLYSHAARFAQGIMDARQILYFLVFIAASLAVAAASYASKRISERRDRA